MNTATLAVGAKVTYDGEVWTVVDLAGSRATIEKAGGGSRSVAITRLLSPPIRFLADEVPAVAGVGPVFSSLMRRSGPSSMIDLDTSGNC